MPPLTFYLLYPFNAIHPAHFYFCYPTLCLIDLVSNHCLCVLLLGIIAGINRVKLLNIYAFCDVMFYNAFYVARCHCCTILLSIHYFIHRGFEAMTLVGCNAFWGPFLDGPLIRVYLFVWECSLLVGMTAMVLSQVVSRNQTSLLTSFGAPADTHVSDGRENAPHPAPTCTHLLCPTPIHISALFSARASLTISLCMPFDD